MMMDLRPICLLDFVDFLTRAAHSDFTYGVDYCGRAVRAHALRAAVAHLERTPCPPALPTAPASRAGRPAEAKQRERRSRRRLALRASSRGLEAWEATLTPPANSGTPPRHTLRHRRAFKKAQTARGPWARVAGEAAATGARACAAGALRAATRRARAAPRRAPQAARCYSR